MKTEEKKQTNGRSECVQRESDRRAFHLKTLCDLVRELSGHADTEKIMEAFLLMTMGAFGTTQGFVLLIEAETLKGQLVSRGLEGDDIRVLYKNIPQIVQQYFSASTREKPSLPMEAHLLAREGASPHSFCPHQTEVLIRWYINKELLGLLGLGAKLLNKPYCNEDIDFLLSLSNNLMVYISNARSVAVIRQLNRDLREKNNELEEALKGTEHIQTELDGRIFHLKTLCDTMHELSGLADSEKIMETFLLMTMGTFSVGQGYILLFDRKERTARTAFRGFAKNKVERLLGDEIEKITAKLFGHPKNNKLVPMKAYQVTSRGQLDREALPLGAKIGILFSIDETCLGLLGLGDRLTAQDYSEAEQELLLTLANNYMIFLKNTRSFETIQKLNLDLEKRNLELEKSIEELTASRHRIEVLERAKARIRAAIQNQMKRTRQVSLMDFLLILGVGLVLGFIFNFSNPGGVNLVPQSWFRKPPPAIDVDWAKLRYDTGTSLFVDARPPEFFRQRHIPGAINLPPTLFDFVYMMKLNTLDQNKEIIVYGRNVSRLYDEEVAFKLVSRGFVNVRLLSGGLSAWRKRGHPSES